MPSPAFPGQNEFRGRILHSHSYKDHRGFEDRRVVVVGVGNSGGDIAVELSRIADQVYLSTRRGAWIINRIADYGVPSDVIFSTRLNLLVLRRILPESWVSAIVERKLQSRFDHTRYGLRPAHGVFGAHPTVNDELPNRIACGTIVMKPNIHRFMPDGTSIQFDDGTIVDRIDVVVMSTGYSFAFPMVESGTLIPVVDNRVHLYKYMYVPTLAHPTLAVLGLIQPLGSIMPIAEMQSRVYFDVLTKRSRLPSMAEIIDDMQRKKMEMDARYVDSRRHTIQVDYIPYMDELAEIIGARPSIISTALYDPQLAYRLLFGPNVAYVYRLCGPHRWEGAREAIVNVWQRIDGATQTRIVASVDNGNRDEIETKSYGQVITMKIYFLIGIVVTYLFWALF